MEAERRQMLLQMRIDGRISRWTRNGDFDYLLKSSAIVIAMVYARAMNLVEALYLLGKKSVLELIIYIFAVTY
jgi:hypothetical protein